MKRIWLLFTIFIVHWTVSGVVEHTQKFDTEPAAMAFATDLAKDDHNTNIVVEEAQL